MRVISFTIAAWIGVGLYVILAFLFNATLMVVMIIAAVLIMECPERLAPSKSWLVPAVTLLIPTSLLLDHHSVAAAWVLTVPYILATSLLVGSPPSSRSAVSWSWHAATGLAVGTVVVYLAAAVGIIPSRAGPANQTSETLTPDMRDIWFAVRDRTPANSLIFTDQTGSGGQRGWNDYPLISARQFYIVSWVLSPVFRYNPAMQFERLQENAAVLSGTLHPDQLHLSRTYASYFAVISNKREAPPDAEMVYANAQYSLYDLKR
jgi:hypothetical protein